MRRVFSQYLLLTFFVASTCAGFAQSGYKVVAVGDGGTIAGTVKWGGTVPHALDFPITKDPQICDPDSKKSVDLERLVIGPQGGLANTIVYLKNISAGKAMDLPQPRRHLDQKHCHYIPHILLVPESATLTMMSSDATLHTIHMDGAASFNLPFPFTDRPITRTMATPGLVHLRCNGGHVWMNAEMMVVPHPYYAVTDESGRFEFTNQTTDYAVSDIGYVGNTDTTPPSFPFNFIPITAGGIARRLSAPDALANGALPAPW